MEQQIKEVTEKIINGTITLVVWLVADCGRLSYQIIQNYKRVVTLNISTNTAINYTTGYSQLIFKL